MENDAKNSELNLDSGPYDCPIYMDKIVDPVTTPCGHTFEKAALEAHRITHKSLIEDQRVKGIKIKEGDEICPCPGCGQPLPPLPEGAAFATNLMLKLAFGEIAELSADKERLLSEKNKLQEAIDKEKNAKIAVRKTNHALQEDKKTLETQLQEANIKTEKAEERAQKAERQLQALSSTSEAKITELTQAAEARQAAQQTTMDAQLAEIAALKAQLAALAQRASADLSPPSVSASSASSDVSSRESSLSPKSAQTPQIAEEEKLEDQKLDHPPSPTFAVEPSEEEQFAAATQLSLASVADQEAHLTQVAIDDSFNPNAQAQATTSASTSGPNRIVESDVLSESKRNDVPASPEINDLINKFALMTITAGTRNSPPQFAKYLQNLQKEVAKTGDGHEERFLTVLLKAADSFEKFIQTRPPHFTTQELQKMEENQPLLDRMYEFEENRFVAAKTTAQEKEDLLRVHEEHKTNAKAGDREAQYALGVTYLNGLLVLGIEKDLRKAAKLFRASANQNHPGAQRMLGSMYLVGKPETGIAEDLKEAERLLTLAANQGDGRAFNFLGALYSNKQNFRKAMEFYEKAIQAGYGDAADSLQELRKHLESATSTSAHADAPKTASAKRNAKRKEREKKAKKAEKEKAQAAANSSTSNLPSTSIPEAAADKSKAKTDPVKPNEEKFGTAENQHQIKEAIAAEATALAANAGSKEAQYNLGTYHLNGAYGFKQSDAIAIDWFQKSADQGYPQAQRALGTIYMLSNTALAPDEKKAEELLLLAAEQDDAIAQFNLSQLYQKKPGIRYPSESKKWCKRAAQNGHSDAQRALARSYLTEAKPNPLTMMENACHWLEQSAAQGNMHAQYELGVLYFAKGMLEDAERWFDQAKQQGHVDAGYKLQMVQRYRADKNTHHLKQLYSLTAPPDAKGSKQAANFLQIALNAAQIIKKQYLSDKPNLSAVSEMEKSNPPRSPSTLTAKEKAEAEAKAKAEVSKLQLAANMGKDKQAQYRLGVHYLDGTGGLQQSDQQAAKWFKASADQGYAQAQYTLGTLHLVGRGVPKNLGSAAQWLEKAAAQNHQDAKNKLQMIQSESPVNEIPLVADDQKFDQPRLADATLTGKEKEDAHEAPPVWPLLGAVGHFNHPPQQPVPVPAPIEANRADDAGQSASAHAVPHAEP